MIFVPSLLFTFTAIQRLFFEASRIPSHGLTLSTAIPGLCEYNTPQTSRLHNIQYVRALDPFPISSCDSMLFNNSRYNSWTYLPLVSDQIGRDECQLANSDASNVTSIIKKFIPCSKSGPFDGIRGCRCVPRPDGIHHPTSEPSSVSIRNEMSKLKHEIRLRTVRTTQTVVTSKADSRTRRSSTL